MNRFAWDLRYAPPGAEGGAAEGPQVLPGTYTARLTVAGRNYTQPLKVTLDPRSTATPEDLSKQLELGLSAASPHLKIQDRALSVPKLDGNRLDFSLQLPALPEGKYDLTARLKKDSKTLGQRHVTLILADPPMNAP